MSCARLVCRSAIEPRPSFVLALVAASAWLVACGGDDSSARTDADPSSGDESDATCPWEPDELLAEVDVSATGIRDCNLGPHEGTARDCFMSAMASGEAAQLTTNRCIDCLILSTFVSLANQGKFLLYREADYYGDSLRVVRVDSCTVIVPALANELGCTEPATLYEQRSASRSAQPLREVRQVENRQNSCGAAARRLFPLPAPPSNVERRRGVIVAQLIDHRILEEPRSASRPSRIVPALNRARASSPDSRSWTG